MLENNSMYSGSSSPEYEQSNEEVQVTEQSVMSQIFDENSSNLSTQSDIAPNLSEENRVLKEELDKLRSEFASFKETAQYVQNETLVNEVNTMRQIVASAKRAEQERAVVPIMETLKEMGVPLKDIPTVFSEIKQQFNVDLKVTPNVDLVRYYVENSNWVNPSNIYTTPKGGYHQQATYYNPQYTAPQTSYDDAAYQAKLEAAKKKIWEDAAKRYSK